MMQKRILNIWTVIAVLALITGILCNGLFPFMYLAFGTVLAMGSTVIGFIIDLITKSSKGIRVTGFIFLFFLIATITSLVGMKISENRTTKVSNKVIRSLNSHKSKTGRFPKSIDQLQLDSKIKSSFTKAQQYLTDSSMQQFEIRGWSDGWHVKTFRSRDSTWVTID